MVQTKLKNPHCKKLSRKNDIRPFEDMESLTFLTEKNDCSLFAFANHSKKRPNNLTLGRMFDHQLLDMVEFGVSNFRSLEEFDQSISVGAKPFFVFKGSKFSNDLKYIEIQSLLLDSFRGELFDKMSLNGVEWVITCTASEETDTIYFRPYKILLKTSGSKVHYQLSNQLSLIQ